MFDDESLSQYVRFHRVASQPQFDETRSMEITAANVDLNNWLAGGAKTNTKRTAGGRGDGGEKLVGDPYERSASTGASG